MAALMYSMRSTAVAGGDSYNALIHGMGAGNREITGYYAVTTDRLLSLLFAERT
jgi:hypothetical protein